MSMRIITTGKDKGWCRCERCGGLLVPDAARYADHLRDCGGTDAAVWRSASGVSLAAYAALVKDLPLPTKEQIDAFADYVSHAHSWYKHLSLYPPGTEFHFFINPNAGRDRLRGTPMVRDRKEQGFHYADIPTDDYLSAFGYLAYTCDPRNNVPLVIPAVNAPPNTAARFGTSAVVRGLPDEVFRGGATRLTGAMHTQAACNAWLWREERLREGVEWPERSGGLAALKEIFARCKRMRDPDFEREYLERPGPRSRKPYPSSDEHMAFVDKVLYELLAPEQRRQRAEIAKAIGKMCDVITVMADSRV